MLSYGGVSRRAGRSPLGPLPRGGKLGPDRCRPGCLLLDRQASLLFLFGSLLVETDGWTRWWVPAVTLRAAGFPARFGPTVLQTARGIGTRRHLEMARRPGAAPGSRGFGDRAAHCWRPPHRQDGPRPRTRTWTVRLLRPAPLHWARRGREDRGDRSRTGGARLMRPGGGPPLPADSRLDGAPARYLAGAPSLATTCPDFRPRARKSWPGRGPPKSGPHAARHRHFSAGVRSIARSGQSPPGRQVFSLARDPGSRVALRLALCRSPVSRGSRAPAGRYLTKNKHPCPA